MARRKSGGCLLELFLFPFALLSECLKFTKKRWH